MPLQDPRTLRTVGSLREAARRMLDSETHTPLTVSGVCRLAQVRRTTFYTHYTCVGDLVVDVLTSRIDAALDASGAPGPGAGRVTRALDGALLAAFGAVEEDRRVFRRAVASPLVSSLRLSLEATFAERLRADAAELRAGAAGEAPDDARVDVTVTFAAAGLAAALCVFARLDAPPRDYVATVRELLSTWWRVPSLTA